MTTEEWNEVMSVSTHTAEDFLFRNVDKTEAGVNLSFIWTDVAIKAMKDFAKLHVQKALEEVATKLQFSQNKEYNDKIKESILSLYPSENIK